MEKGKRSKSMNGEIQLPEAMIQHIQSFMIGKEAARTTILSKSWHTAWLTRPNLDFDESEFRTTNGFLEIVTNTIKRYQDLNLKIESFRLRTMSNENFVVNELVMTSIKMGATDLNLEFVNPKFGVFIPKGVLGSETLVGLSLSGRSIRGKVSCSRLQSLTLHNVCAYGRVIQNISSICPLIQKLSFDMIISNVNRTTFCRNDLREFHKLKCLLLENVCARPSFFNDFAFKLPCLKDLAVHGCHSFEAIRISSPSLERMSFKQDTARVEFDFPSITKFKLSSSIVPSLPFKTLSREWESDMLIFVVTRIVLGRA